MSDHDKKRRWHLTSYRVLGWKDRLRVLCGARIFYRFESPDGECHAACHIALRVQRDWPADSECWADG